MQTDGHAASYMRNFLKLSVCSLQLWCTAAHASTLLQARKDYYAAVGTIGVAVADVNHDGLLDIVTVTQQDTICTLLGTAAMTFSLYGRTPVGDGPQAIALADVNADGNLDAVIANYGESHTVSVMLGNGLGSFTLAHTGVALPGPLSVAVADLDNDERPDIVVADQNTAALSVFYGLGNGIFEVQQSLAGLGEPNGVVIKDVNDDGVKDILFANQGSSKVSVYFGQGASRTYRPRVDFDTDTSPRWMAMGDMNGDGIDDVVTCNSDALDLSVLLGDGAGGFGPPINHVTNSLGLSVGCGDFDGDGKLDVAMAAPFENKIYIVHGNGNGTFGGIDILDATPYPYTLAVADINHDGHPDLVVTHPAGGNTVSVWLSKSPDSDSGTVGQDGELGLLGLSPNPSRGGLTLRLGVKEPGRTTASVYDIGGRLAWRQDIGNLTAGTVERGINVAGLPPGLYAVEVKQKGIRLGLKRVVIVR